jgi:hypothetical protein
MEKTIQLDQRELQQAGQIDQARMQALAQIGALSMDMEQAKRNLEVANEQQRSFMRQALAAHGIEQFDSARPVPNGILVTIPDSIANAVTGSSEQSAKVNGLPLAA